MRIVILTVGSQGDVLPYIALGRGLQAAGHEVLIATQAAYQALVRYHGLSSAVVGGDPREVFAGEGGQARLETIRNPLHFTRLLARNFHPFISNLRLRIKRLLNDYWQVCQGAEAIIFSPTAKAGYHIAERLNIPCFMAPLQPQSRTRAFPSLLMPAGLRLGASFNWLSHILFEQLFWQLFRQEFNQWRQETLNLPPLGLISPYSRLKKPLPCLYGYSPLVVPKPPDWPPWIYVTGYWLLDSAASGWQPSPQLVDFLADGPPPVYIGFGSMIDRQAESVTRVALEALARCGQRGVLQSGWTGLGEADLPRGVIRIEASPHDWLFPRMAAVVHHGGAGTVAAGLRAGVPSIITPAMADQPFWGQRVAALGVGPKPIPYRRLSVERLAEAIRIATTDRLMRERAEALGRKIRAEDGVQRAVEAFHSHLSGKR